MADERKLSNLYGLLGSGMANKAAKQLGGRGSQIDKAVDEATAVPEQDKSKGVNAGELGKKYEDSFHF